jgi:hypothetical protein
MSENQFHAPTEPLTKISLVYFNFSIFWQKILDCLQ